MKQLEEMNVIDNFLFTAIMADDQNGLELCRMILTCVLKRKIGRIRFTAQKVVPGVSEETHGIRLDAYITESEEDSEGNYRDISIYDIEPDKKVTERSALPRRSRYYGDLIDVQLLNASTDYDKLPELVTIFILSYDPFGENSMYYEAGSVLRTHPEIPYDDGIRRIFLYVDGNLPKGAGEADQKLRTLLRYINRSTAENAVDENTRKLDEIVKTTKSKKDVGVNYMKSWEILRDAREEGLAEGREEGFAEGREEGLLIGRKEERANTERERKRAEAAEKRALDAERRVVELEEALATKA